MPAIKSPNQGHRKRLREKFLNSGFSGFLDYEIVELLLTLGTPRKDCKLLAKKLISKFKTLNSVLDAPSESIQETKGIGPANVLGIRLFHELNKVYQKEKVEPKKLLDSTNDVYEYLKEKIGRNKKECFVVLCLDTKNKLIVDEVSVGTLNASLVHPREVFNIAIANHASHVIIAHNHPSGDPTPSPEDIETTKRLVEAGKIIGIGVIDHIVVSNTGYSSLKVLGHMDR